MLSSKRIKSSLLILLVVLLLTTGFGFATGYAQYYLAAVLHEKGYFLTARYFYQLAIHREIKESYYFLGVIYLHGQGVEPNAQIALEYFEKAVISGYVHANFALAGHFLKGTNGFELNPLKAYYWYKVAECQTGRSTSLDLYWIKKRNPHLIKTIEQLGDPCDYMYTDFAKNLGPSTITCEQWLKGK
jgi:signal transduction histidine kinase